LSRVVLGFMIIGIAIALMLAPTLLDLEVNWPFILGLWVGVVGLMLINSSSREEDKARKEIFEKRMRERQKQRHKEADEGSSDCGEDGDSMQ